MEITKCIRDVDKDNKFKREILIEGRCSCIYRSAYYWRKENNYSYGYSYMSFIGIVVVKDIDMVIVIVMVK